MSLCECKITSALKRFCVIIGRSQVLTRLVKEKDLSDVPLVAPVFSAIFINGDYVINDDTFLKRDDF